MVNPLIQALREQTKTSYLFKSNGTFISYRTGFPAMDYAMGFNVNVFNKEGKLDHIYPAIGITGGSIVTIIGGSHVGKAQPVDTKIPTPDGEKMLGELKIGDYVFNRHGKPVKILNIFNRGKLDSYEVKFTDGINVRCNDDHLWSYLTFDKNGEPKLDTKTLREIIDDGLYNEDSTFKYLIPMNKPVEYSEKEFEIHPYIMGVFCSHSMDEINELKIIKTVSLLLDIDEEAASKYLEDNRKYYDRIPEEYFYGSIQQRTDFITGFIDCSEKISHMNMTVITMFNPKINLDLRKMFNSLGIIAFLLKDEIHIIPL